MKEKVKQSEKEKIVSEPTIVYDKELNAIKSVTIVSGKYDDIKGFEINP